MSPLELVLLLALALAVVVGILLFAGRQRCPRCDASLPRSARQCPYCGQVLGLALFPDAPPASGPPRYCPECKGEFRSEVAVCPDCEVTLQDHLPAPDPEASQPGSRGPLQTLCSATTPEEADFLISILAEQNIRAVVMEDERSPVDSLHAPLVSIGAGWIAVAEMDLARAKEVLASVEADAEVLPAELEDGQEWACEVCGAEVGPTAAVCPRCGAEFEENEE